MSLTPSTMRARGRAVDQHTIIIGAGPAGLAVGACLQQAGIPFVILEKSDRVAAAWHAHYQRLHLHTDKAHSTLPFVRFPSDCPRYPSRLQVISYLEGYARQFHLEPRLGEGVVAARHADGFWEVHTSGSEYRAPTLVIATGYNSEPHIPVWPGQASFRGPLLHSSRYRDGEPFRGQSVLVVGFGNSGGEIAIDLWEHGASVGLAVRSRVNVIPRELFGIPILTIGLLERKLPPRVADALNALLLRLTIGDLTHYGLRKLPYGPMTQALHDSRVPLIDVGTVGLIKRGQVSIYPGIESFINDEVVFPDGTRRAFDAVILATGYRPQVDRFLVDASAAHAASGAPSSSGRESAIPGLYFCGFYVAPTGMLREIGLEARRISTAIARNYAGAVAPPTRMRT